jgi:DNA replication and repair protein RecF
MSLLGLQVEDLRCLKRLELELDPAVNLLVGPNASGKTSILEAIYLLGRGRSFRTRLTERLIRHEASRLQVLGTTDGEPGHSLGFGFDRLSGVSARIDREPVKSLADLTEIFPVQAVDPGIHRLVEEGPVYRRRWLDWGVFHVEPGFGRTWAEFSKVIKQRNAALRQQQPTEPWDESFVRLGEALTEARVRVLGALAPYWQQSIQNLLGEPLTLGHFRGWAQDHALAESLALHRIRDEERGTTGVGPQRFDVLLRVDGRAAREVLSRGQQKLLGAALVLALTRLVADRGRRPPTLLLDDPAAELDVAHTDALIQEVRAVQGQLIVTSLQSERTRFGTVQRAFHVEHGRVERL